MGRRSARPASERPTAETKKKAIQRAALFEKRLDPLARKLLQAKKVGKTLMDAISRVAPRAHQISVAMAVYKGGMNEQALFTALNSKGSPGYRKRVIELCRKIAESED